MKEQVKTGQPFNPFKLFVGSFLPNALLQYRGLSASSKLVWARLAQYAARAGVAYPKLETLAVEVGFRPRYLRKILKELKRQGFIRITKPTGKDRLAHRPDAYFFLLHPCLTPDRTERGTPDGSNWTRRDESGWTRPIEENPNEDSLSRPADGPETVRPKAPNPDKHPRWKKYATLLHDAISKVHKVNYTSKLPSWARSFRLLHTQEKIALPRIKKVLRWYCSALADASPYLPVAHSGPAFREKFSRIEAAMLRQEQDNGGESKEAQDPMAITVFERTMVEDDGTLDD